MHVCLCVYMQQRQYHLATKKYTQAGNKVKVCGLMIVMWVLICVVYGRGMCFFNFYFLAKFLFLFFLKLFFFFFSFCLTFFFVGERNISFGFKCQMD